MLTVLSVASFRSLFLAQIIALIGTGLATVALGLLAFELAGGDAALVLGGVFAIKMIAYVAVAPIAGAFAVRVPRRALLVTLDVIRAACALSLPLVSEVWQIYLIIVVLQASSAAFTPVFQATIPDILTDEEDYTRALSLSRLAYDLEAMLSPLLAAALLSVVTFDALFGGTSLAFVVSALLVASVVLPTVTPGPARPIYEQTTRGVRHYLATPRLRALLALCFAVSSAGAMVLVNTVVMVQGDLGLSARAVAMTMAAFGLGSMVAALALPRLLEGASDRQVMLPGAGVMGGALIALPLSAALYGLTWPLVLLVWFLVGLGYSAILTPSGRLLRRSSHAVDRPGLFAAQFALSHACWLVTYPLAGVLMTWGGVGIASGVLGGLTMVSLVLAMRLWPDPDTVAVPHSHPELSSDHPHLQEHRRTLHPYVIDDLHPRWPTSRPPRV
ncbi:MAG: MFS transporter [Pseudomonadota bacterium]